MVLATVQRKTGFKAESELEEHSLGLGCPGAVSYRTEYKREDG